MPQPALLNRITRADQHALLCTVLRLRATRGALKDLAALSGVGDELTAWAMRYHLNQPWVLEIARATVAWWGSPRLAHVAKSERWRYGWKLPPLGGWAHKRGARYVGGFAFAASARGHPESERWRSRDVHAVLDLGQEQSLRTVSDQHLALFALWLVAGKSVGQLRRVWLLGPSRGPRGPELDSEIDTSGAIRKRLGQLVQGFGLARPRKPPGRPRVASSAP